LLESHPSNPNAYLEFLDILFNLESEEDAYSPFNYKALSKNTATYEIFASGLECLEKTPEVSSRLVILEEALSQKGLSLAKLKIKYDSILKDREREMEEFKSYIEEHKED
jgi:predicted transcriptional regulator